MRAVACLCRMTELSLVRLPIKFGGLKMAI